MAIPAVRKPIMTLYSGITCPFSHRHYQEASGSLERRCLRPCTEDRLNFWAANLVILLYNDKPA